MAALKIAAVGLGGYGRFYLDLLLKHAGAQDVRLVAAVDPHPERCGQLTELQARKIPVYPSLEAFFQQDRADVVTLAVPIHLHAPLACQALAHGCHVLCEKPLGATVQEAAAMIEARERAGTQLAIGYQWSFSEAVQGLKRDIRKGLFGRPKRLKCLVLWPRRASYYARNPWAGKQRSPRGEWVLDSPANNAAAHYLHNLFYMLGEAPDRSARPERVVAELARAKPIENFDTAALRCFTDQGVEILFYCSHSVRENEGPAFEFEFERATLLFDAASGEIVAQRPGGAAKRYGNPGAEAQRKLWRTVEAARGGPPVVCGPEAARAQTLCINGAQDSMPELLEFPSGKIVSEERDGETLVWVPGLRETMWAAYRQAKLPSELGTGAGAGAEWARPGREIGLADYTRYPGGGRL